MIYDVSFHLFSAFISRRFSFQPVYITKSCRVMSGHVHSLQQGSGAWLTALCLGFGGIAKRKPCFIRASFVLASFSFLFL